MSNRRPKLPSGLTGLSARLLVLTIGFVMLSEVLIYAPSIARFARTGSRTASRPRISRRSRSRSRRTTW